MEASIALKNVAKGYTNRRVLSDISFGVETGTIFCVASTSGSGKTTLTHILATLVQPDIGSVYIKGMQVDENIRTVRKLFGFLPEKNTLNPENTIFENLRIHGILAGMKPSESVERANELLSRFELTDHARDFPDTLSYSMRRRVAFIRAIMPKPEILLLDEPTTNVDFYTRKLLWEYLREKRGDTTIFLTARAVHDAEKYADRIMILDEGRIVIDGEPETLRLDAEQGTFYNLVFQNEYEKYRQSLENNSQVEFLQQEQNSFLFRLKDGSEILKIIHEFGQDEITHFAVKELTLNDFLVELSEKEQLID